MPCHLSLGPVGGRVGGTGAEVISVMSGLAGMLILPQRLSLSLRNSR
jgi:hypothetical protein